jgi:hypothetical protein
MPMLTFANMKKLLLLLILLCGCQDNEPDSPEMATEEAQQIGSTSVVMGGNIKAVGPVRPINFGFLWDTNQDLNVVAAKNKIVLGATSDPRKFSINLSNLTPATTYYYCAFSADDRYTKIYYGNTITFNTLP